MAQEAEGRVVIDTRTSEEYQGGHLKGARNIDFFAEDFKAQLNALDRDTPYAVYCRSGNRSAQTLALMRSMDFRDVIELEGGIVAWQAAGKDLCGECKKTGADVRR